MNLYGLGFALGKRREGDIKTEDRRIEHEYAVQRQKNIELTNELVQADRDESILTKNYWTERDNTILPLFEKVRQTKELVLKLSRSDPETGEFLGSGPEFEKLAQATRDLNVAWLGYKEETVRQNEKGKRFGINIPLSQLEADSAEEASARAGAMIRIAASQKLNDLGFDTKGNRITMPPDFLARAGQVAMNNSRKPGSPEYFVRLARAQTHFPNSTYAKQQTERELAVLNVAEQRRERYYDRQVQGAQLAISFLKTGIEAQQLIETRKATELSAAEGALNKHTGFKQTAISAIDNLKRLRNQVKSRSFDGARDIIQTLTNLKLQADERKEFEGLSKAYNDVQEKIDAGQEFEDAKILGHINSSLEYFGKRRDNAIIAEVYWSNQWVSKLDGYINSDKITPGAKELLNKARAIYDQQLPFGTDKQAPSKFINNPNNQGYHEETEDILREMLIEGRGATALPEPSQFLNPQTQIVQGTPYNDLLGNVSNATNVGRNVFGAETTTRSGSPNIPPPFFPTSDRPSVEPPPPDFRAFGKTLSELPAPGESGEVEDATATLTRLGVSGNFAFDALPHAGGARVDVLDMDPGTFKLADGTDLTSSDITDSIMSLRTYAIQELKITDPYSGVLIGERATDREVEDIFNSRHDLSTKLPEGNQAEIAQVDAEMNSRLEKQVWSKLDLKNAEGTPMKTKEALQYRLRRLKNLDAEFKANRKELGILKMPGRGVTADERFRSSRFFLGIDPGRETIGQLVTDEMAYKFNPKKFSNINLGEKGYVHKKGDNIIVFKDRDHDALALHILKNEVYEYLYLDKTRNPAPRLSLKNIHPELETGNNITQDISSLGAALRVVNRVEGDANRKRRKIVPPGQGRAHKEQSIRRRSQLRNSIYKNWSHKLASDKAITIEDLNGTFFRAGHTLELSLFNPNPPGGGVPLPTPTTLGLGANTQNKYVNRQGRRQGARPKVPVVQ